MVSDAVNLAAQILLTCRKYINLGYCTLGRRGILVAICARKNQSYWGHLQNDKKELFYDSVLHSSDFLMKLSGFFKNINNPTQR